jgi:hypothetical protein
MKKAILALLVLSTVIVSFRNPDPAPISLCEAVKTIIKDEPAEFANLKTELIRTNEDGTKDYGVKFAITGWPSVEYAKSDATSVDIRSETSTKEKANALFEATGKQIADCLGMKGKLLQAPGADRLVVFTKDKTDTAIMLVTTDGKSFVMVTISRE